MVYNDNVKKLLLLLKHYPSDPVEMPYLDNGEVAYEKIKRLPKKTKEEKITYCALSNKVFGTYTFATFSKLTEEQLEDAISLFNFLWGIGDDS